VLGASATFVFASAATAMAATWPGGGQPLSASATSAVHHNGATQVYRTSQFRSQQVAAALLQHQQALAAAASAAKARAASAEAAKRRQQARAKAAAAAAVAAAAKARLQAELHSGDPRQVAQAMLSQFGWSASQFSCLDPLWVRESNWNLYATNPSSGAYGIPQALPAGKMASAGPDWQTSAATQIRWGLGYIRDVYGSPCGAWSHETSYGWY